MGLFGRKKKEEHISEEERLNEELRDDISKAYDELISGGADSVDEQADSAENNATPKQNVGDLEAELLKSRIQTFKEKKTQEALTEIVKMLPGRQFCLPSVSNMKQPFENVNGEVKLKKGAVLSPALLTSPDKKTYLPVFTSEKDMTRKSPSGIVMRMPFEQCVSIVLDKKNPVQAITINPFSENLTFGADALGAMFKQVPKSDS